MGKFAVIGVGRFGSHLATKLYELGHDVLAVDSEGEILQGIRDRVSQVAEIDVRDKAQVRALGLKDFDTVIISVGEHLEASTLAALYCKELELHVVARAVNADHGKILEALGVDEVVYPERDMAVKLAERLASGNLLDYISLGPEFSIIEMAVPDSFVGRTLVQLNIRQRYHVHVIAVRDVLKDELVLAPPPDAVLRDTDVLVVLGRTDDLEKIQKVR